MKKIILTLVIYFLYQGNIFAVGNVTDAKITTIYCGYVGTHEMCSLTFNKPIADKDECHTASDRMQFKPGTAIGNAILSVALSAHASQSNVNVYSTGNCTIFNGIADVNWITIKSN